MNKRILSWMLFISLSLTPVAAYTQTRCEQIDSRVNIDRYDQLIDLETAKCLGGTVDTDALTTTIVNELNQAGKSLAERRRAVRQALQLLSMNLAEQESGLAFPKEAKLNALTVIRNEILRTDQEFANQPDTLSLTGAHWSFDPDDGIIGQNLYRLKAELFTPACKPPASASSCTAAYQIAKESVRATTLMRRIGDYWGKPDLREFGRKLSLIREQWNQYATQTRSQFIWELGLNSWRYDRKLKDPTLLREPPNYQVILLHPSVAMEYVDQADDGTRFQPAIVMEWLGWNGWKWDTQGGIRMKRPLGLSVISTFADHGGTDIVGYGLMAHYNHSYSFGVSVRNGDIGVFFSVDLQKYLSTNTSKIENVRRRFDMD